MSLPAVDITLRSTVERYVAHQRALGKRFRWQAYVLASLVAYVERAKAADLDAALFDAWCRSGKGKSSNARRGCQLVVHKFCRYRRRLYPKCFVPDATRFARRTQSRVPVIFGAPEVVRMLRFAAMLPGHPHHPMRGPALRLIIILLYTTGMRRGEVTHLSLSDIDLKAATIRIRDSKFHKTRIVPLSSSTLAAVRAYLRVRLAPPWDISPDAPLFGHQHGTVVFRPYADVAMTHFVSTALAAARVFDAEGRPAHVHDFRHSFAVQALLRWYRQGVDVSARLPQLSMYMGHVSIASTALYLHFIPEVARAASRRFHREFGDLLGGVS
jgi:integrase